MLYSQNGYQACNPALIAKYTIPGSPVTINLRKGDVSVVLLDFFGWYHQNIEPLRQSDTGGYNCRTVEDSETVSNHASGTAGDLRWRDHARGRRNEGFTQAEVDKIDNKLKEYGGVIRWGNNYSTIPDTMHYEINRGPAEVKRQADRIREEDLVTTQSEFNTLMDTWWNNRMAPGDDNQSKAVQALRVAPWQQEVGRTGESTHNKLFGTMAAQLAAIYSTDVSEEEIAAKLLAVLTPEAIAAAIPENIASQVADELAARLGN